MDLVGKEPGEMVAELERYGFAALWLYTGGLERDQLEIWRQWKRQPDYRSPQGDLWVYRLNPSPRPELPEMKPCRTLSPAFLGPEEDGRFRMKWRWVWGRARIDPKKARKAKL